MNPQYHSDIRGFAFNVKDYTQYSRDMRGTASQREAAYQLAQRRWWADAKAAAIRHGFEDIGACGRSGGWAYPVPVIKPSTRDTDPDGFADDLRRLEALGADLATMMSERDERFTAALDEVIDEDLAADAEAERAAAATMARTAAIDKLIELATHTAERPGATITLHMAKLASDALGVLQPCATN